MAEIVDRINKYVSEVVAPIPTRLNNISTQTLEMYGNKKIEKLEIMRDALKKHWTGAINILSLGKFDELQKKHGFDKLYHLVLFATVDGQKIIIEKNEVINIEPFKPSMVSPTSEYMEVPLRNKNLTLNEMMDRTKKLMGDELFYDYDALGTDGKKANNCQNFIMNILKSSNLLDRNNLNFLYQNVNVISEDFKNSKFSYLPNVLKGITRLGSHVSRFIGKGNKKGKKTKKIKDFEQFVMNRGFAFI